MRLAAAGPLTVARLFRTVLLFFFLTVFAGRDDLAMYGYCCRVRVGTARQKACCVPAQNAFGITSASEMSVFASVPVDRTRCGESATGHASLNVSR